MKLDKFLEMIRLAEGAHGMCSYVKIFSDCSGTFYDEGDNEIFSFTSSGELVNGFAKANKVELTLDEIADKFDTPVEKIKIKK